MYGCFFNFKDFLCWEVYLLKIINIHFQFSFIFPKFSKNVCNLGYIQLYLWNLPEDKMILSFYSTNT